MNCKSLLRLSDIFEAAPNSVLICCIFNNLVASVFHFTNYPVVNFTSIFKSSISNLILISHFSFSINTLLHSSLSCSRLSLSYLPSSSFYNIYSLKVLTSFSNCSPLNSYFFSSCCICIIIICSSIFSLAFL